MANTVSSRKRQFYVKPEVAWGTAVAPTNSDCVLMEDLNLTPVQGEIQRPDLTGDDGELLGMPGPRSCTWSNKMSAALSGAPGTKPDAHTLLEAALGAAGVVVASTSVTYPLGPALSSMSLYEYVTNPATATQRAAIGAIVNGFKLTLGAAVPLWEFSGEALWAPDSAEFADVNMDLTAKGGLTAIPTIPISPVTNGTPPPGFKMTATLDAVSYTSFRTATIALNFNRELPKDTIGGYPTAPASGLYEATIDFGIYDDDSAALTILKQKAKSKTPVILAFAVGSTPGNIATYTLKNVMLGTAVYETTGKRRAVTFNGSRAHNTAVGAADAFQLVCT